jgi:hypothetical protein
MQFASFLSIPDAGVMLNDVKHLSSIDHLCDGAEIPRWRSE